jgi:hypothetical protein
LIALAMPITVIVEAMFSPPLLVIVIPIAVELIACVICLAIGLYKDREK